MNRFAPLSIQFDALPPEVGPPEETLLYAAKSLLLEAEAALDVFDETGEDLHMAVSGEYPGWQDLDVIEKHEEAEALLPYFTARRLMSAKAFVASLARLERTLHALADRAPSLFADAARAFSEALPMVRELRNSAEHSEDRIRLLGPYRKPITPNDASFVGIDNLFGARLDTLQPDGTQGTIDVTEATLAAAYRIMRTVAERIPPHTGDSERAEGPAYLMHEDLVSAWRCCKCAGGPYDGRYVVLRGGFAEWVGVANLISDGGPDDRELLPPPTGGVYRLSEGGTELVWLPREA